MKEYGTALGVNGGRVTVSVKRTAACDRCGKCSHPHIAFGGDGAVTVEAIPIGDIRPGDTVELEMDSEEFLKASFLLWTLPLVAAGGGFGIGWLVGEASGKGGLWGTVFSVCSFALSFVWLHQYDKSARRSGRYLPYARSVKGL